MIAVVVRQVSTTTSTSIAGGRGGGVPRWVPEPFDRVWGVPAGLVVLGLAGLLVYAFVKAFAEQAAKNTADRLTAPKPPAERSPQAVEGGRPDLEAAPSAGSTVPSPVVEVAGAPAGGVARKGVAVGASAQGGASGPAPAGGPVWDVFIAHAGPNKPAAEELFDLLAGGCRPFVDSRCLRLGDDWDLALPEAQRESRYTVVLVSASTERAFYQREEIAQAIAMARRDSEAHRVVPVYLDGPPDEISDVPYGLRVKQGIRLRDGVGLAQVADRLLAELPPAGSAALAAAPSSTAAVPAAAVRKPAAVWNVPFLRNAEFVGRVDLLSRLEQEKSGPIAVTAAAGMGGVGKTQLAVEYAYSHRDRFDLVWWVRADTPTLLVSDLADLAVQLGVVPVETDQETAARTAKDRLETSGQNWLLIFDNAPNPDAVKAWLPTGGNGQTLITSRHPNWGGIATPVPVGVFEPDVAVKYLCTRTGNNDRDGAGQVAETLGRLALALAQAASYMLNTGRSFADYQRILERDAAVLDIPADGSNDNERTVATVWLSAFNEANTRNPLAGELLGICGYCSPEAIPLALFEQPDPDSSGWSPSQIDRAVAVLRSFSLVEPGVDSTISVHRLIQRVTRHQHDQPTADQHLTTLARLLRQTFPTDTADPDNWPLCAQLLPHVAAIADHAQL